MIKRVLLAYLCNLIGLSVSSILGSICLYKFELFIYSSGLIDKKVLVLLNDESKLLVPSAQNITINVHNACDIAHNFRT